MSLKAMMQSKTDLVEEARLLREEREEAIHWGRGQRDAAEYWQNKAEALQKDLYTEKMNHAIQLAMALHDPERGRANDMARRLMEAAEMLAESDKPSHRLLPTIRPEIPVAA